MHSTLRSAAPLVFVLLTVSSSPAQGPAAGPTTGASRAPAVAQLTPTPVVVRKQGAVAQNRTHEVSVVGAPRVKVGDLADRAFSDVRTRNGQLTNATRALLSAATHEENFTETDASTTLEIVTKFTVVDPDAFRSAVPAFASYHAGMRDRGTFSVSKLSAQAKAGFDAYKAELARGPANHPLRGPMQRGDDALLDAIAAGKGDVTIRTRMIVPKSETVISGKRANVPPVIGTTFDHGQTTPRDFKLVPSAIESVPKVVVEDSTDRSGTNVRISKFLTGFTKHRSFDWEERWEFGTRDYVGIGVHAGYALGVRIPVEVTSRMSPTLIHNKASSDTPGTFEVLLSGRALDGDEAFYMNAGLSKSEAFEGKELVLEADAYASIDVVAGWGTINIHERVPGNLGFDFGQNFTPPFNDCGTSCGVDVWVPATVTRTEISLLGIVTGKAQIGFNLGGTGRVGVDYTSLFGDDPVDSKQGETRRTQSLSFGRTTDERKVETTLPAITSGARLMMSGSRKYGYKLSNPSYVWNLVATPGVKGTISVNARPFFSLEEVIGPFWLRPFAMDLGSLSFAAHAGTKSTVKVQVGEKSFGTATQVIAVPAATGVMPK